MTTAEATTIADLNDRFRKGDNRLGITQVTAGVNALTSEQQQELFRLVRVFDDFTAENDPYRARDFGSVEMDGEKYFWKIDLDLDMRYHPKVPSDLASTHRTVIIQPQRILIIMHSSEILKHKARATQSTHSL
jgi:hypothetical protein